MLTKLAPGTQVLGMRHRGSLPPNMPVVNHDIDAAIAASTGCFHMAHGLLRSIERLPSI